MKDFIRPILQALGIVTGGWAVTNIIRAVCTSSLFIILGVLIAIKMITGTIISQVRESRQEDLERYRMQMLEKQAVRDHEVRLQQIEFDKKLNRKIEIDNLIKEATTKKELLELQLKASEEQLKAINEKLERLRAIEKAHLSALPLRPINIETIGKTYTNVYWIRNDPMGVLYKFASGTGGGCISYASLMPDSVKLLGLIDDIESKIGTENAIAATKERERQARLSATPQYVYQQPLEYYTPARNYATTMFQRRYGIGSPYGNRY